MEVPDHGYAWVVLGGSCIVNTILSGMSRMIGLLYVEVIHDYGVTRQEASVPFIVRNAVRYLAGPLTGVLGQTYGIRTVTLLGGLVAAAGSILCAFAPNVQWIVFAWGIIHGLGFALAITLFNLLINAYFERHRATATGLVLSGACLGAMFFPILIEELIAHYGLSGCFLLLGGLFLNILPPAILLKEPDWVKFPEAYARMRARLSNLPSDRKQNESKFLNKSTCEKSAAVPKCDSTGFGNKEVRPQSVICTIYRSIDPDEYMQRNFQIGVNNVAYVPDLDENHCKKNPIPRTPASKKASNSFLQNMRALPKLYLNPVYVLISWSVVTYFSALLPLLAVIVDYSRDKGIPVANEKFLFYFLNIGDLLGRLCFGWMTDREYISLPYIMTLTFLLKGTSLILLTVPDSLLASGAVLGLYGLTAGTGIVYFPILVHRYVEPHNQTIGMGSMGLLSGIATFGLPPLIGYFRDYVGSYDGMFYILASFSVVTSALWLLVPAYERRREVNQEPTKT